MATAKQVIDSALKAIMVQGASVDLQPEEYQDAIFSMNNFMFQLDADGVSLGYTEVNSLDDTVTIPSGALRGLVANLAIEIAPSYGGFVSPALQNSAANGGATMEKIAVKEALEPSQYPTGLPTGVANTAYYEGASRFYHSDQEHKILTENNGTISLEDSTEH